MKTNQLIKIAGLAFGLCLMLLFVLSFVAPELHDTVLAFMGATGGGGVLLGEVAVIGTPTSRGTKESAPDHQERDISTAVTEMKPDEFPLDTMLRKIRTSESAKNEKVEYESVKYRERVSQTSVTFTANADVNLNDNVELTVTDVKIWGVDDTAFFPSVYGANDQELRVHVIAVDRATNKIRISALNGTGTTGQGVPTIPSGSTMCRMGTAKDEIASTTDIITQLPAQDFNFCQIHMCFLEQSVVNSLIKSYSGYSHKDKMVQEIYNMRSSMEATNLFGFKKDFIDPIDGKKKYHSDGIISKIQKKKEYSGTDASAPIQIADVLDLLEETFSQNAGSERRLLLAGKKVITNLQKIPLTREIGNMEINVQHGVSVKSLESNFGMLDIKHSKMLDAFGWEEKALVLDLSQIRKHDLEKMKVESLDPDKAGQRRVKDSKRILENSCITLRYPDTHLIWEKA